MALLTGCGGFGILTAMLQHNVAPTAKSAHLAHAAVLSVHSLCCGLPALAVTLAALGVSGISFGGALTGLHTLIHGHEFWILALSAVLVTVGGAMEWNARRSCGAKGAPWLFVMSACCFVANVAIIAVHRGLTF
jgi:hypothetical protein